MTDLIKIRAEDTWLGVRRLKREDKINTIDNMV
jgi:hypothetical protein